MRIMSNMKKDYFSSRIKGSLLPILHYLLFVLSFLFFLFLSSCVPVESSVLNKEEVVAKKGFDFIPESDEKVYAQRIASEIEGEATILKDEFLNNYLDEIGEMIVSRVKFRDLLGDWEWSFNIIDSSDVNAFATLGGQVYLHRGLIKCTELESELAGILAFEIGHVMARHVHQHISEKLMKQADFSPGEKITGEEGWEKLYRIFMDGGGVLAFFSSLKYDPSQVEKADEFALSNNYDAGFNPLGFVTLVHRLGKKEKPSPFWIRKNPWNEEREEKISASLELLPPFPSLEEYSRFNKFKVQLQSLTFPFLQEEGEEYSVSEREIVIHRCPVLGDMDWTDTGLEVIKDQEIYFNASGQISLQRGNQIAYCGPDGYPRKTMQQPFSDKNIGALIGKVVLPISIEIDEETGEEIRHEIVEEFYVGSENKVKMPVSGRLFLGINELVVGDNSGEYKVIIHLPFTLYPLRYFFS